MNGMRWKTLLLLAVSALIAAMITSRIFAADNPSAVNDWPDWRGPNRDGTSGAKGLAEKWSLAGENLAWKAPYGGRSMPKR